MLTHVEGFRLSPMQKRLWQLGDGCDNSIYRVQTAVRIQGQIDAVHLQQAVCEVVGRNEILRTMFYKTEAMKVPIQVIQEQVELSFATHDLADLAETDRMSGVQELFKAMMKTPLELEKGPLLQVQLVKLAAEDQILILGLPAMCQDASVQLLVREIIQAHSAMLLGKQHGEADDDERIQYSAVAEWFNGLLEDEDGEEARAYWNRQDLAAHQNITLHLAQGTTAAAFVPQEVEHVVPAELTDQLIDVASSCNASLESVMLAGWNVLLGRYTGQEDVMVGVYCDGRIDEAIVESIGLYAKYVPLIAQVQADEPFAELVRRVHAGRQEAYDRQEGFSCGEAENLPFGFDFLEERSFRSDAGLTVTPLFTHARIDRFQIRLSVIRGDQELRMCLGYEQGLFAKEDMERLLENYVELLRSLTGLKAPLVRELELVSEQEKHLQQVVWNQTSVPVPEVGGLHRWFEKQVNRTPENRAVMCEGLSVTYAELNARANQLARQLRTNGVERGAFVGLYAERSLEMVIAMLGILKAGAAYLPLDPDSPAERLARMLENAGPKVIVTQKHLANVLPEHQAIVLILDAETDESSANLEIDAQPEDPAYVLYTSGSTGVPKGVVVPHRAICNHMHWMQQQFPYEESDVVLQKTSTGFDASVWEFYAPLLAGGCLLMARPGGHVDVHYLIETIQQQGVTQLQLVPTMLRVLLNETEFEGCTSLKRVYCGGEALTAGLQRHFFETLADADLINLYGPTEACIDSTYWVCRRESSQTAVPIGLPISNAQLYVLDEQLRPVPIGTIGELYIGGQGLALGYLNQPDLTAERFIPHPFANDPQARLYRTGDLVRYQADGALECLGRSDDQIKIRGQRMELGEIEAVLAAHPDVMTSAVVAHKGEDGYRLVGYYVPKPTDATVALTNDSVRSFLVERLPEAMIPSRFVSLSEMPLTTSGKVDRKRLPLPSDEQPEPSQVYVAPRNTMEQEITDIWQELLDIEVIGVHDTFFELGGHSLDATRLISRINRRFGVALPLKSLFEAQTIARLAEQVEQRQGAEEAPGVASVPRQERHGLHELSHGQERLWFGYQVAGPDAGNLYAAEVNGELQTDLFVQAMHALVERHDIMRTTIAERDGEFFQEVHQNLTPPIVLHDWSDLDEETQVEKLYHHVVQEQQTLFDLTKHSFFRMNLFKMAGNRHLFLMVAHHIGYDGWSSIVVLKDLQQLYLWLLDGRSTSELESVLQYADYAVWQNQRLKQGALEPQKQYWLRQLADDLEVPRLPHDDAQEINPDDGGFVVVTLDSELAEGLRALALQTENTMYQTALAAFNIWWSRETRESTVTVGTTLSGRTHPELEDVLGLMINPAAMRTDLSGNPSGLQVLERVKEMAFGVYANQDYPFDLVMQDLKHQQNEALYHVVFMGQNASVDAETNMHGVRITPLSIEQSLSDKGRNLAGNGDKQAFNQFFDLMVSLIESEGAITLEARYNTERLGSETVRGHMEQFESVLRHLVAHPDDRLSQYDALEEDVLDDLF